MGLWDVLGSLFPDSLLHIEQDNTTVNFVQGDGSESATAVTENEDGTYVVDVDLGTLEEEEREQVLAGMHETWEETGDIFLQDTQRDKKAIESASDDIGIQQTLDFFSEFLSERYFGMLKASLFLRRAWEGDEEYMSPREVQKRKDDIAEKYGSEAHTVSNLCTAGYFDEDGYIRQLFDMMGESGEYQSSDYQTVFEEIIENQPFTVFVGHGDSPPQIRRELEQKLERSQQYSVDIDFVDVRAMGGGNRSKVETVMSELQEDANTLRYEGRVHERESVFRVYPDSVDGLGLDE